MDVNEEKTFLMFIPKTKQLFPISEIALTYSQNSKKNLNNTVGALLVDVYGNTRKVSNIKRLGFYGDSAIEKLKSFIFGVYAIKVDLVDESLEFDFLKNLICEYVLLDLKSGDPVLDEISDDVEVVINEIEQSETMSRIFDIIKMPVANECLDAL